MGIRAVEPARTCGVTGHELGTTRRARLPKRAAIAATIAGVAALTLLSACASSGSSSASAPASASGTVMLKTGTTSLGKTLTDSQGMTVYWFAADHGTMSACSGACAAVWPPVIGTPHAAAGVTLTGTLGTITRSDGTKQATYNGHPLYTFKSDTSPGQVTGDKVTNFGAEWFAVTASSSSSSTGGGASTAPTSGATKGTSWG